MDVSTNNGLLYQQIKKLLRQYVYQTGVPYLKLDIDVLSCLLSDGLENVTLVVKAESLDFQNSDWFIKENHNIQVKRVLEYRNQPVGSIRLFLPKSDFPNSRICEAFENLPNQIITLLSRNRLYKESNKLFGRSFQWVGTSDCLLKLEKHIDANASGKKNLILLGGAGTGKLIAGLSFHIFGSQRGGPFEISNCADWITFQNKYFFEKLFASAHGGTLYIRHFELLSRISQLQLVNAVNQ